ncbi:MAG TPA: glycosyltransferase family 4 protein [Chloroflexota bacterium]|nr:glycosyltransferase family 4 protein [Chloroflexota bacterium]
MKIALVSPYDYDVPGGVGKHIAALTRQFRAAGHEVRIIAPGSSDSVVEDREGIYRVGRVTPVPGNGSVARITLSVPFVSGLSRRVRQVLAAEHFDVIHVHEPLMPSLPVAVLLAGGGSAARIGTFHAYRESYYGYYYGRPVLRRVVNKLDGRVCVSRAAFEFVSRYFPGAYSIIPNGVDLHMFNERVEPFPRYRDGRPTVLFVGRIEKRKGLAFLIRAYQDLRLRLPDVRILVVGRSGRAGRAYQRYARAHELTGIEFAGEVSAADLPRYYQSCDVFCSPAISGESFGMVLLEAMALGKPVVATAIDGYKQVMQDGRQGRLVPPRDASALAQALLELLVSPDDRRRMGNQGKVTAAAFSWERVSSRLLQFYDEVRLESIGHGWRPPVDLELSHPHDADLDLIHAEALAAGGPIRGLGPPVGG